MPTDEYKIGWTQSVELLEGTPAHRRDEDGSNLKRGLDSAERWTDTASGLFSEGWDSYQGLQSRIARARASGIAAQRGVTLDPNTSTLSQLPGALADRAKDIGKGVSDTAEKVGKNLGLAAENAAKLATIAPYLLLLVVLGALFLRYRGRA